MNEFNFKDLLNKEVILTGMTKDAKGGAVLIINEIPIYIEGLSLWPDKYFGKMIKVRGKLKDKKMIPDPYIEENGAISQGAIGNQLVLEDFEILD